MADTVSIEPVQYLGGFAFAPDAGPVGELRFTDDVVGVFVQYSGWKKFGWSPCVPVPRIRSIDITSEQVARSKVGATLLFGVLGAAGAKATDDRVTIQIYLKIGDIGFFVLEGLSAARVQALVRPWMQNKGIPFGDASKLAAAPTPAALSVADELQKLAALRIAGVLTDEEFASEKAKLLS